MLHISAIATSQSIQQIQWVLSYPPEASKAERHRYLQLWQSILKELQPRTGMVYSCPKTLESDDFRAADHAFAQYFAEIERHDLIYTSCIQLEPSTANLAIWENNRMIHHGTFALGERHLFGKFLELNPEFIERRFGANPKDWQGLTSDLFYTKLDVLLRWESEAWLRDQRPTFNSTFNNTEDDVQGLVRLIALGLSGFYYYIGILLRVLHQEEKYSRNRITPVYLGGRSSRLLHWLDPNGQFTSHSEVDEFLSRMLARGSGFEDTQERTRLSQRPQDEVACGLVVEGTRLQGWDISKKDPIIPGENCQLNGTRWGWEQRLETAGHIKTLQIPTLTNLSRFLYDFHRALRELEMEGICPIKGYTPSLDLSDNWRLWDGTQRELEQLLHSQILGRESDRIRLEPPFILGLKALLNYLGREWAGREP